MRSTVPGASSTSCAFGRRHDTAAADQNAGDRALQAAEDAADDAADRRAACRSSRRRPDSRRFRAPA